MEKFMGMSRTNFLDGLVEQTGLNGHELYDYLTKLITDSPQTKPETTTIFCPKENVVIFEGDIAAIKQYYLVKGGNPKVASYFGCCIPELICTHCASVLNITEFYWKKPRQKTFMRYGVKWNNKAGAYIDITPKMEDKINETLQQ